MAKIKIISEAPLYDGMPVTFKAPCNCTAVDGIKVCYGEESQEFGFRDAHGNDLAGIGNLFAEGAYVKAILNTADGHAYLQNADTNAYLEERFANIDVSGPIAEHNADSAAHSDIRAAVATAKSTADSKAPMYTYGTTDLTAGSSALETGKLHFVYE